MESLSFDRIVTWSMSAFTSLFQFERNNLAAMLRVCVVSMAWMACSMAPLMSQVFNLEDEAQQGINQYHEINVGVADTPFGWFDISPGFSVLIVHRKQGADSKLFFEYGYGGALPTIVTGKVGVGVSGKSNANLSVGVRVFPTHGYVRLGIPLNTNQGKMELALSYEHSGRDLSPTLQQLSFGSARMLTVGLCMDIQ